MHFEFLKRKSSSKKNVAQREAVSRAVRGCIEQLEDRTLFAAIATDRSDYTFGSTAVITGNGFAPGETVQLQVQNAPGDGSNDDPQNQPWQVQADEAGNVASSWVVDDPDAAGALYDLTAVGLSSGESAETTFTDSSSIQSATVNGSASATVAAGSTITIGLTVKNTSGDNWRATGYRISTTSGTYTVVNTPNHDGSSTNTDSFTVTAPATNGTYNLYLIVYHDDAGTQADGTLVANGAIVVKTGASLAASTATGTYGGTVNLSATLTSGASGVSGKAVTFKLNGNTVGTGTTNASGIATLSNASLSGINAGTYASGITASFAGDGTYVAASGTNSLTVNKATPTATLVVSNSPRTYNGAGQAATVGISTSSVPGTVSNILTGGAASQTNAGTYAVMASFVPNDTTNYNTLTGLSAGNFVINQAAPAVSITGYTGGTYDGNAHTQTVTVTGVGGDGQLYTNSLSGTTAGSYILPWSYSSNNNYSAVSGTLAFDIAKANALISVNGYSVTYDDQPHSATGSAAGVNGEDLSSLLNLSGTTHTNAGTYNNDPWSFAGNQNYNVTSGNVNDSISQVITSTSIISDLNPAAAGDTVTFTATVNSNSGSPTGDVYFYDGNNLLGSGSVSGGQATFSTFALSVGSHAISATYVPDNSGFAGSSTTTGVNEQINAASVTSETVNGARNGNQVTLAAALAQRANVVSVVVKFDINVYGATSDDDFSTAFTLLKKNNLSSYVSSGVTLSVARASWDSKSLIVSFVPAAGLVANNGSLLDGAYKLHLNAAGFRALASTPSDLSFVRIFGDFSGDGKVTTTDLAMFTSAKYGSAGDSNWWFDGNSNGSVDVTDYNLAKAALGKSVIA